jgi:hypothetical protein
MTVRKPTKKASEKDYFSWLREGIEKGYCSDVYCENHDTTAPGSNDFEEYMMYVEEYGSRDFCWPIMRSYYGVEG